MTLKVGYHHTPEYYYVFHPHPKSTVLNLLMLIDPKTGNATVHSVRKLPLKFRIKKDV